MVFENKQMSFLQVIFSISHWLRSWAILQKTASQDMVVAASQFLDKVAKECFPRQMGGGLVFGLIAINVSLFSVLV